MRSWVRNSEGKQELGKETGNVGILVHPTFSYRMKPQDHEGEAKQLLIFEYKA